jgi:transcriptional regulator with XRE-family HTH domain
MLPRMLEQNRKRTGWSVGQAAMELGLSIREYRKLEAGKRSPTWETFDCEDVDVAEPALRVFESRDLFPHVRPSERAADVEVTQPLILPCRGYRAHEWLQ